MTISFIKALALTYVMPPGEWWCNGNGPVAQSGRAPPLQGGGLGFKSRRVHLSAVT